MTKEHAICRSQKHGRRSEQQMTPVQGQEAAPLHWHSSRPEHRCLPRAGTLRCWRSHISQVGLAPPAEYERPLSTGV